MTQTIVIEGFEYDVEGDVFTTPDGLYDVFLTEDGYAYVPINKETDESFDEGLAKRSYLAGWVVIGAALTIILSIVIGLLK